VGERKRENVLNARLIQMGAPMWPFRSEHGSARTSAAAVHLSTTVVPGTTYNADSFVQIDPWDS